MVIEYSVLEQFKPFLLGYCNCGCGRNITIHRKIVRKFISGHNTEKGLSHFNWQGGRRKLDDYWYLWLPEYFSSSKVGTVREHVYNFQEYHQCCMLPWGIVHHIIPVSKGGSNLPYNLQGMMNYQHPLIHAVRDMSNRKCRYCGSNTTKKEGNSYHWYGNESDGYVCKDCYDKRRKRDWKKDWLRRKAKRKSYLTQSK